MPYVDGFCDPVPKDKIEAYKAQGAKAGEVWKEYGAPPSSNALATRGPLGN